MRQQYDTKALQSILDQYNGMGTIKKSHLFTFGFENSNYYVETDRGRYVTKIYEGMDMSPKNIEFEVEVMDKSFQAGVKTPHIHRNKKGKLITKLKEKLTIVMDFIEGENMHQREVSDDVIHEAGKETGKMDVVLADYKDGSLTRQNYEFDSKTFLILEDKVQHLPKDFDRNIFADIFTKFRKIKPLLDKFPTGLIHNDVDLHNLLVKDDTLMGIVDFSDLAFSPYIQNITVPMSQLIFTYNWKPNQAKIFIDGYKEHHPLSSEELSVLYNFTLVRYAIIIIELHYWDVRFGADKQRTGYVKDYYGFLKKFIKIGRDNFNKLIL